MIQDPKPNVLFLCTHNACRSQMAEGWAKHLLRERINAFSAGISPTQVDPRAVTAMKEAGVSLLDHRSRHMDELRDVQFDYVITVCDHANEVCPVFPGKATRLHVGFDDPPRLAAGASNEEQALVHYRRVRDEIRQFVESLPQRLNLKES